VAQRRVRRLALGGGRRQREEKGRRDLGQYELLGRERARRRRCVASCAAHALAYFRQNANKILLKKTFFFKKLCSERVRHQRVHPGARDSAFPALQAGRAARCGDGAGAHPN